MIKNCLKAIYLKQNFLFVFIEWNEIKLEDLSFLKKCLVFRLVLFYSWKWYLRISKRWVNKKFQKTKIFEFYFFLLSQNKMFFKFFVKNKSKRLEIVKNETFETEILEPKFHLSTSTKKI